MVRDIVNATPTKRALQAWAVDVLRALAGIDDHLCQLEVVQLGVGFHLGALGIQAHAAVGLLLGAHPQVRDRSRSRHESDVRSLVPRVKRSATPATSLTRTAPGWLQIPSYASECS